MNTHDCKQVKELITYCTNPFNRYYFPLCVRRREIEIKKLTGRTVAELSPLRIEPLRIKYNNYGFNEPI